MSSILPLPSTRATSAMYGTFAIEGLTISKDTRSNLDRIGSGQASYQQIVNELRAKYAKKD